MKILLLLSIFNSYNSYSNECNKKETIVINSELKIEQLIALTDEVQPFSKMNYKKSDDERRGCCSWHGGVCGCSNGRAVCCDKTFSPTCGCD